MSPAKIKENLTENNGPFTLHISDGRTFKVAHVDYLLLSPDGEEIAFYPEGHGLRIIDTRQITSIEFRKKKAA